MTTFPITNNSAHHFTSGEYAALARYITTRTTDEILRAEITDTQISVSTRYGSSAFKLIDVFPKPVKIHWEPIIDPGQDQETEKYVNMDPRESFRFSLNLCPACKGNGFFIHSISPQGLVKYSSCQDCNGTGSK